MKNNITNQMDEYMKKYTELWAFSGAIAAIKDGEVIFEKAYGYANVEHQVKNTLETKFRIYSITKQFTAVAILLLEERGLLKISDSVKKHFPDWNELDERITIHQLLTHTSGLPNYSGNESWNKNRGQNVIATRKDLIEFVNTKPLDFDPGTSWDYCNTGYFILEMLIEILSGISYTEFLISNIFLPIGMHDTGVVNDFKLVKNQASGYYLDGYDLSPCEYVNMNVISGSGGIYSAVGDMLLWDQALHGDGLLSRASIDKMNTIYKNENGSGEDYGYGVEIIVDGDKKIVWHNGGYRGFYPALYRHIDDDFAIVILTNYQFTATDKLCRELAKVALGKEYEIPTKPPVFNLSPETIESYMGFYGDEDDSVEMFQVEDAFYLLENGKFRLPIYPINENTFHHTWIDEQYEVDKEEDGSLSIWGCKKK